MEGKRHFLDLTLVEFQQLLATHGEPSFRAKQVWDWIYAKRTHDPNAMSNLSPKTRQSLISDLNWSLPEKIDELRGEDGTTKILFRGDRNQLIETVVMRYDGRTTVCVSSQVGCKLACAFCQTGKLGFFRNLAIGEILAQIYVADQILLPEGRRVTNVVFMGMGEPLDNFDNSIAAANRMMDPTAFGLSNRHVTLSTSGIAPRIKQLPDVTKASLALSLHAANDDLRTELMPINRKYPLSDVADAIHHFQDATNKKVTIEYILIKDKNCGLTHAKDLVRFLQGLSAKVNLIPFNAHPGLPYQRPSDEDIRAFQQHLSDRSIPAPVRYSRGLDVSAACGQLAAKNIESLSAVPARNRVIAPSPSV